MTRRKPRKAAEPSNQQTNACTGLRKHTLIWSDWTGKVPAKRSLWFSIFALCRGQKIASVTEAVVHSARSPTVAFQLDKLCWFSATPWRPLSCPGSSSQLQPPHPPGGTAWKRWHKNTNPAASSANPVAFFTSNWLNSNDVAFTSACQRLGSSWYILVLFQQFRKPGKRFRIRSILAC